MPRETNRDWIAAQRPLLNIARDPLPFADGAELGSVYVETFWLPILGPTCVLLARRLGVWLAATDGIQVDLDVLAREMGLGPAGGTSSPIVRSLDRLCGWGFARNAGDYLAIQPVAPFLSVKQVVRLPEHLQGQHAAFMENHWTARGGSSTSATGASEASSSARRCSRRAPAATR